MKDSLRRIRATVDALCAPECAGRETGTPQSARARDRIVAELQAAGVEPAGTDGWLQPVPSCNGANVLGRIAARGKLANRHVMVAAHYDHLGIAPGGEAFWGADDNAAAVAVLTEVARVLQARRQELRRSVLLVSFDAEEPPHFMSDSMGSQHWVKEPTVPLHSLDMMVCMDLVGHAVGPRELPADVRESLFVMGAELSEGTGALMDGLATAVSGVRPRRLGLDVIPPLSDYLAFQQAQVPVLFLTCGRFEHYHQVTDTPDKLDYPKIGAIALWLAEATLRLSTRTEAPVRFRAGGRDDIATITTLLELARALAPHAEQAAQAIPVLQTLSRDAAEGPLTRSNRGLLAFLVASFEGAFA